MRALPLLLCGVLGSLGCVSTSYVYRPTEQVSATVEGRPASRYAIPPERPEGEVLVSSAGVTRIVLGEEDEEPFAALHVRFVIANNGGEQDWKLDTRDIHLDFDGLEEMSPALVNAAVTGLPIIAISPGRKRVIDIYYPLPSRFRGAEDIPSFDVLWKVETDERTIAERTPFDRFRLVPESRPTVYYNYGLGFSSYWWHDPYFPSPMIIRRAGPPRSYYDSYPR